MNKNYTTRNFNVLSTKGDFKLFHDYLIDYNVLEKEKQYHFDIVNLSSEGKLNMLVDCVYELSMFKNRLQTTTEKFKPLEVFSFKTMFVNVLEIINLLKPYVLESEFLNKMNVGNYFRAVFDDVMIGDVKYKTKEYDILELLDYFNKKEKEYETKASFYTTAENKPKVIDDTDLNWFIAGLKFVDGTVYECKEVKKEGFTGEEFAKLVFSKKKQEENMSEIEFAQLISNTRGYIGDTINNKTKSLFKKTNKYKSQWHKIYDYHKKQGGKIDSRFAEEFLKTYNETIE